MGYQKHPPEIHKKLFRSYRYIIQVLVELSTLHIDVTRILTSTH